jgi:hypothetical protein
MGARVGPRAEGNKQENEMDRPTGTPVAVVEDSENRMEVLVFACHGQFAVYWQIAQDAEDRDDWRWVLGPNHHKTVIAAIRSAYYHGLEQH